MLPNPSLEVTRYGMARKARTRQTHHRRVRALRATPPRSPQLER